MKTQDLKAYHSLPGDVKAPILALSVLMDRISSLPKADRDELFELVSVWHTADDEEERISAHRAMEEILAQCPIGSRPMPAPDADDDDLRAWKTIIGKKIRDLRLKAALTQEELAKKAGLPQSHISRLENAEHSPTNLTLGRIANALGVEIGQLDPNGDD